MIDEKTMLIDCHAHTAEVSPCCKSTAEEVLIATKKRGVDGIILTNHYADYYVLVSKIYADAAEMAKKHLEEKSTDFLCFSELRYRCRQVRDFICSCMAWTKNSCMTICICIRIRKKSFIMP